VSKKASSTAIGGFIIGILGLTVALIFFFGGEDWLSKKVYFTLLYDSQIKGLKVGAPVAIRGVNIGEVVDIKLRVYSDTLDVLSVVIIEVNPDSLERVGKTSVTVLDDMFAKGLRAQLKLQSLLTGLLYIDIDYYPGSKLGLKDVPTQFPQFPTVPTDLEAITQTLDEIDVKSLVKGLQEIVSGVDQLINNSEAQTISGSANDALISIKQLADNLNTEIGTIEQAISPVMHNANDLILQLNRQLTATLNNLNQTFIKLERVADNAEFLLSDDSPLLNQLSEATAKVAAAAQGISALTESIKRQPEAILKGKKEY
jgi:phospholipid/cholesterol/gamma-HCH transport system substrate-binding protein